jgi:threonine aldolase
VNEEESLVDLRSDTVTQPTEGMRRAMVDAPLGDDVFGEDPTVNRLEEYVAARLGKEAALYCPSGTMTNQIGVYVATRRGDEVILHEGAHLFNYEAGAPALLSGVQVRPISGEGGVVSTETLRAAIRPENVHFPRPKLLCLENTHNLAGGRIFPFEEFAAVVNEARSLGLKVHLDGARLFNAEVATGIQAGVIAAASLYAFEHHVERLVEDHERARKLAEGLAKAGYAVEMPETNIVLVEVGNPEKFLAELAEEGVLATPHTASTIRCVTHHDVGDEEVDAAVEALAGLAVHPL